MSRVFEEYMNEFVEKDRFASFLGIHPVECSKGRAKVLLDIIEDHLNGAGVVHGGAIFSIADFAFALASNSKGSKALSIDASISFFKGVNKGRIFAEAYEISSSNRLASYRIDVTHEDGSLLAAFQGTVYKK